MYVDSNIVEDVLYHYKLYHYLFTIIFFIINSFDKLFLVRTAQFGHFTLGHFAVYIAFKLSITSARFTCSRLPARNNYKKNQIPGGRNYR